jgi:hypothetical protein
VRREILYNNLVEFASPIKLVRLSKSCLIGTYNGVRIGKHLSDNFPIRNGLKQENALSPLLFNVALEDAVLKVQEKVGGTEMEWDTPAFILC